MNLYKYIYIYICIFCLLRTKYFNIYAHKEEMEEDLKEINSNVYRKGSSWIYIDWKNNIYIYIYIFTQKTKINNTMIQYDYTTYIHMYLILKNTSIHTHYFTYFPIKTYYAKHNKTKK